MYRSPFVKEEVPFVTLFRALELNTSSIKPVSCGIYFRLGCLSPTTGNHGRQSFMRPDRAVPFQIDCRHRELRHDF